jgi:hypothetical protein
MEISPSKQATILVIYTGHLYSYLDCIGPYLILEKFKGLEALERSSYFVPGSSDSRGPELISVYSCSRMQ